MKYMNKQNLQTLKGFRDFLPEEAKKRQYLKDKFRQVFEFFGFEPLETPALEYQDLLLEKYGKETDKLVYKFEDRGGRKIALRYDQTVPTSRVLAMYKDKLLMPWKRYQIQNVWRAEKPQKGRFREFTQCDIDIFGTTSPLSDAELLAAGSYLLKELGFKNYKILLNDRNILFELMRKANIPENKHFSVIQAIDKLDKKTKEEVEKELIEKGLSADMVTGLFNQIKKQKPTPLLEKVISYAKLLGIEPKYIKFEPHLARGLAYYTGTIYEFTIDKYKGGSVAGGGRYDNLIKKLSEVDIPATGYSWGFDRLLEALDQLKLQPSNEEKNTALISIFNSDYAEKSLTLTQKLRERNIKAEIYPDANSSLKKQLKYADKKKIRWFIVIGPDEAKKGSAILKDLETGHQEDIKIDRIIKKLRIDKNLLQ